VLRVDAVDRSLPATHCDGLESFALIRAAFGVISTRQLRLSTGTTVTVQEVTPGFGRFVGTPGTAQAASRDALVGGTIAARIGATDGGWLSFDVPSSRLAAAVLTTDVLAVSPRTSAFDDSVVITQPAARAELAGSLGAVAPERVTISAYRPDIETETEPDRRLAALPGNLLTIGGAGLLALTLLGWWFVRRAEWALYRSFGVGALGLVGVAVTEWAIAVGGPVLAGGMWALAASDVSVELVAVQLGLANLAVTVVASFLAVGLWIAYVPRASVNILLRGF